MNQLILDKSDPNVADALADCKVGQPKTLTLTVVPTMDDDTAFKADVTKVAYTPDAESPTEDLPPDSEAAEGEMPEAVKAVSGKY